MDDLTEERFQPPPPPRREPKPNRWGDTARQQAQRRKDLVEAMRGYEEEHHAAA